MMLQTYVKPVELRSCDAVHVLCTFNLSVRLLLDQMCDLHV